MLYLPHLNLHKALYNFHTPIPTFPIYTYFTPIPTFPYILILPPSRPSRIYLLYPHPGLPVYTYYTPIPAFPQGGRSNEIHFMGAKRNRGEDKIKIFFTVIFAITPSLKSDSKIIEALITKVVLES